MPAKFHQQRGFNNKENAQPSCRSATYAGMPTAACCCLAHNAPCTCCAMRRLGCASAPVQAALNTLCHTTERMPRHLQSNELPWRTSERTPLLHRHRKRAPRPPAREQAALTLPKEPTASAAPWQPRAPGRGRTGSSSRPRCGAPPRSRGRSRAPPQRARRSGPVVACQSCATGGPPAGVHTSEQLALC